MELLNIRPAAEADIPFLIDLRRQTMSAHQRASGLIPSDEECLRRVLYRFDCASMIEQSGRTIGLLKVLRGKPEWELVQIQLLPSFQRKGVGTMLLQLLIQEARASNASLKLSVLKANRARSLYERLGFAVVAEKTASYEMKLAAFHLDQSSGCGTSVAVSYETGK